MLNCLHGAQLHSLRVDVDILERPLDLLQRLGEVVTGFGVVEKASIRPGTTAGHGEIGLVSAVKDGGRPNMVPGHRAEVKIEDHESMENVRPGLQGEADVVDAVANRAVWRLPGVLEAFAVMLEG